ncbi:MAG TPA: hypothetical protein PKA64_06185 [Myxococcota bacterium]|nr:hypothetical protein [Myxococcota bacterium]
MSVLVLAVLSACAPQDPAAQLPDAAPPAHGHPDRLARVRRRTARPHAASPARGPRGARPPPRRPLTGPGGAPCFVNNRVCGDLDGPRFIGAHTSRVGQTSDVMSVDVPTTLPLGAEVRFQVFALTRNAGAISAVVTGTVAVAPNRPPTSASVTPGPDPAYATSTLACTPVEANDPDGDPVTFTRAWTVNGAAVGAGATLNGSSFSRGDSVSCTVTPTDGMDAGAPVTSNTSTIADSPPAVGQVTLSPGLAYETTTLTATTTTSDADGDPVTVTWDWPVNGAPLAAHQATLSGTYFNHGDSVRATATPNDGAVLGAPATSAAVEGRVARTTPPRPRRRCTASRCRSPARRRRPRRARPPTAARTSRTTSSSAIDAPRREVIGSRRWRDPPR